ncbi:MAG: 50S ribosomal protein L24 [Kiritimatiellae bacterium]|nr:50S ribosomal protein L24 [Kiritimatiellia bacterium]
MKWKRWRVARPHIKKGDMVVAIAGVDAAAGKSGKVLRVMPREGRALVEGFNYVKKHMRKSQDNPQGGIVEKEAPVALSNLRLQVGAEAKTAKAAKTARAKEKAPAESAGAARAGKPAKAARKSS